MVERFKEQQSESRSEPTSIERLGGSPEDGVPASKEIFNLVGIAHHLSQEELRKHLIEIADRVAKLEGESRTDTLTGLLNKKAFVEEIYRLKSVFTREREDGQHMKTPTALLMVDLDGFKEVNDSCGHHCGDRCLQILSKQIGEVLRESDVFARLGGDEFGIFLTKNSETEALVVAEKVRTIIENTVTEAMRREFPNYKGRLSASIGVVAIDGEGMVDGVSMSVTDVIKNADYVAYVVKAAGKGGELTLDGARKVDADGKFGEDFNSGKVLPR